MLSDVEISNIALSHIGVSKTIASLTEQSKEAAVCNRFISITKDMVLRDYKWPFATKIADLALVEEDPNDEWAFSYRYPTDCLLLRRILNGVQHGQSELYYNIVNSLHDSLKVPYKIGRDDSGELVFCSIDDAQAEYTVRVSSGLHVPPDYEICVSYRLAAFIAPSLTSGDPGKLGAQAMQSYLFEASKATANAFNEEQSAQTSESTLSLVRE